ncbi:hypothetical protein DXV76_03565 [Rhodobacteraceae bacterium CCMM004]|nr:hypothetical protein DXV76_03565 [Rhodobacteraceae bacterium CCMM004]
MFTSLSATPSGALFQITQLTMDCTFVLPAVASEGVYDASVTLDRNGDCEDDRLQITREGVILSATLVDQWGPRKIARMAQTQGPAQGERLYPDIAIRGVRLGMTFDEALAALPREMSATSPRPSSNVVRGTRQLDGWYIQAYAPYGGEFANRNASQDNLGLYRVVGDANEGVMGILRSTSPAPLDAPMASAFVDAVVNAYGSPSHRNVSGPQTKLIWHFGLDGQPATGAADQACRRRMTNQNPQRVMAMVFNKLEFYQDGRAGLDTGSVQMPFQPRVGCGYTLEYIVRQRQDGVMQSAIATFFDHRALATEIWGESRTKLDEEITRAQQRLGAAGANAPEL